MKMYFLTWKYFFFDIALNHIKTNISVFQVCLTSNLARGYKVPNFFSHPAKEFFRQELPFSLSCDNILISGDSKIGQPDPILEIVRLAQDVFEDEEEGWKAVRFSLKSGARAALSMDVDHTWVAEYENKVDEIMSKFGILW